MLAGSLPAVSAARSAFRSTLRSPLPAMPPTPRDPADLRFLLVFPPQGHPTQPWLALPSLRA